MRTKAGEPYVLEKGTGVHEMWFPYPGGQVGRYSVKVSGEQTDGRVAQVHMTDQRGAAAPVHIHHGYDEMYYVIAGELTLFLGDERIEASSGSYVFVPQGTPHAFVIRSDGTEFLVSFAPAGLEGFFVEVGSPVTEGAAQPQTRDPEEMTRRAAPYGAEIVGPPPGLD